jgi:hypothetical protein
MDLVSYAKTLRLELLHGLSKYSWRVGQVEMAGGGTTTRRHCCARCYNICRRFSNKTIIKRQFVNTFVF